VLCAWWLCRGVNEAYIHEMSRVSFKLLEVFALGLGLQPTALHHMFQPSHTSFLRLNYYVSSQLMDCTWSGLHLHMYDTSRCMQHGSQS
jgi:isopenicillin N synthase-like dioxygenase